MAGNGALLGPLVHPLCLSAHVVFVSGYLIVLGDPCEVEDPRYIVHQHADSGCKMPEFRSYVYSVISALGTDHMPSVEPCPSMKYQWGYDPKVGGQRLS